MHILLLLVPQVPVAAAAAAFTPGDYVAGAGCIRKLYLV